MRGQSIEHPVDVLVTIRAAKALGQFDVLVEYHAPWRVVLNEYIELSKRFGGTDGHKYVNGVLNGLAPQLRAVEVAADRADARARK